MVSHSPYIPNHPIKCYRCSNVILAPAQARVLDTGDHEKVVVCADEPTCDQYILAYVMELLDALRYSMQTQTVPAAQIYQVLTGAMDKLRLSLNATGEQALSRPTHRCLLCMAPLPASVPGMVICRFCRTK